MTMSVYRCYGKFYGLLDDENDIPTPEIIAQYNLERADAREGWSRVATDANRHTNDGEARVHVFHGDRIRRKYAKIDELKAEIAQLKGAADSVSGRT